MIADGAVDTARNLDPFAVCVGDMPRPVLSPDHAPQSALPPTALPSLRALRHRPHPVSQGHHGFVRALHRYYEARPTPRLFPGSVPLGFLPRSATAETTADQTRSPKFRRIPFGRDGVFDHGGASVPRIAGPHILPSALSTASASTRLGLSRLNIPPHTIAVSASRWLSPPIPQHSLPSARYGLLGPDFHRLECASFLAL